MRDDAKGEPNKATFKAVENELLLLCKNPKKNFSFVFSERCYTFQLQCWSQFWVQKVWVVTGAHSNPNARCLVSFQINYVDVEAHLVVTVNS